MNQQKTFEDYQLEPVALSQSTRLAFIDEYGSFGFDFTKDGTSTYEYLSAVDKTEHK